MTIEGLDDWADDFAAFHARFVHLFGRQKPREKVVKYLRGLMAPVGRKNTWQIAEAVGHRIPDRQQRLLYRVDWEADAARRDLQQFVV